FLERAGLDAVGVFGYSDEEGTAAVDLDDHVDEVEIERRVDLVSRLVDDIALERAEGRVGERIEVIVEEIENGVAFGRAAHQGMDDAGVVLPGVDAQIGDVLAATVVGLDGIDLVGEPA
ncbi:MAG: hypothetical protein VW082_10625, partial [Candidatus Nanopelagicales bacterium]